MILGYDDEVMDEKTEEVFENGTPEGYSYITANDLIFAKNRWSYNHALKTLKEYAMDYMGDMAKDARCVGASNDVILQDNDMSNMYAISEEYAELYQFNEKMKGESSFKKNGEVDKMQSLGILISADQKEYWLAGRNVYKVDSDQRSNYIV